MSHLSKTLDLASELEALSQTFIALDEALERGHDLHPRALFHPACKLTDLAIEIKKHLKEMEKEAEENAIQ